MARNNNPFLRGFDNRMADQFGGVWGVAGDPMGDWLAGLREGAQDAYQQRRQHHPGTSRGAFFKKSAFSPERLQAHWDQFGGGTPSGPWDRRPGRGTRPDPVDPGPGGGTQDPDDDWLNADRPSMFNKHLGTLGFGTNPGPTSFDDWLHNTQFDQSNLEYETWRKDPANFDKQYSEFLRQGTWGDPRAIRERFFSQSPSRRFEGSERYVGSGRTIQY